MVDFAIYYRLLKFAAIHYQLLEFVIIPFVMILTNWTAYIH